MWRNVGSLGTNFWGSENDKIGYFCRNSIGAIRQITKNDQIYDRPRLQLDQTMRQRKENKPTKSRFVPTRTKVQSSLTSRTFPIHLFRSARRVYQHLGRWYLLLLVIKMNRFSKRNRQDSTRSKTKNHDRLAMCFGIFVCLNIISRGKNLENR